MATEHQPIHKLESAMKINKRIPIFATAGALLTITMASLASAQKHPGSVHPFARGEALLRIAQLGLTAKQIDDIKSIVKLQRETVVYDLELLVAEQRTLRAIIEKTPEDEQAIRAQIARRGKIEANLALTRARVTAQIQNVLTPEQRKQSREIFALVDARVDEAIERFSERLAGL